MTTSDLVKEMCQKQGISIAALAKKLGQTRQNFYKKLQRDTLTLTELKQIAEVLDANFEQLFRMPDGTKFSLKSENKKRTVLPLVGSAFEPGGAKEAIERIQDKELSEIAQAELYFFSAQAENCVKIVENYLSSEDIMLRLSADMLYTFANLTLGNAREAQSSREDVYKCLKWAFQEDETNEKKASCVFAFYVISIFIHIPPEENIPPLEKYIPYLPIGQRLFASSLLAHETYLRMEYAKAQGIVQSAMLMSDGTYPISMIYLNCVAAMCQINLREQEEAKKSVSFAWKMARKDGFLEPFIEYHGLLQGVLEACVRKSEPEVYKKLVDGVIAFSRGWMKIHNPKMQKAVTDLLTPLEYSIAMLACRDWTNQEIGEHLGLSVNTVKHYVSRILEKLHIDKRDKIKEFVNQ